jgi:DNA-binding NarL/FixJ family response regulator
MSKSILVADDHDVVRQGVRFILRGHPEWQIVGEAKDGVDAIEKTKSLDPDLLILDISMPRKDGLEVAAELAKLDGRSKILFLTMHDGNEVMLPIRESGAAGFVMKSRATDDLVPAVQEVLDGGVFFPAETPPSLSLKTEKPSTRKKRGTFRLE